MNSSNTGWKRQRILFDPSSKEPFKISRSKIDLYLNCPRCFYFDLHLGVSRPSMPAFSLNNAVDLLLKKEFDTYRSRGVAHPLMKAYKINAVPFDDKRMDEWRDALRRGISILHTPTNFFVRGGIDDVWAAPSGELMIVDYKATATDRVISLDDKWKEGYKRQIEVYQWLFRKNNFQVSDTGYFVFVNGKTDREAFDGKLEFDVQIIPYKGSDIWVEEALRGARKTLELEGAPEGNVECEHCTFVRSREVYEPTSDKPEGETKIPRKKDTHSVHLGKAGNTLFG